MNLARADVDRLAYLLGKDRHEPLTLAERAEVRELLAVDHPRAPELPWDDLLQYGYTLLGAYFLARRLEGATS